jgi:hypothetical protein
MGYFPSLTITQVAFFIVLLSVSAKAENLKLIVDESTGMPGKFAAEEIRREALAQAMTFDQGAITTRITVTVRDKDNAPAQSYTHPCAEQ